MRCAGIWSHYWARQYTDVALAPVVGPFHSQLPGSSHPLVLPFMIFCDAASPKDLRRSTVSPILIVDSLAVAAPLISKARVGHRHLSQSWLTQSRRQLPGTRSLRPLRPWRLTGSKVSSVSVRECGGRGARVAYCGGRTVLRHRVWLSVVRSCEGCTTEHSQRSSRAARTVTWVDGGSAV